MVVEIVATSDRITMVIEGLPEDEGRVRFATFMTQLQNLNATLNRLDREANDGKATVYFEIAELSYNSPIKIVLEGRRARGRALTDGAVIHSLGRVTAALKSDEADLSQLDADLLEDIRKIARPVGRQVKSAALLFNGSTFDLTEGLTSRLDKALAVAEECEGSLDGMLEQINVHSGANLFHIFPAIGPARVACHFPGRLYDDAVAAVGKRVEISGTLKYRAGAVFPHQIAVTAIDIWPPEYELPDWDDLRGRAPDATGDLSSEAFIRDLRDGW